MPAWNFAGLEWALPYEAALLLWAMCAVFGLLLIGALTAFAFELRSILRESRQLLPGSEFQGFGRSAPRMRV